MEKAFVEYICNLHGYLIRLKEIHWNTTSNSEHLLCDEIEDTLCECEDRFAENIMGYYGQHLKIGFLKPLLPNSHELTAMLKELEKETIALKPLAHANDKSGIMNVLDDILECVNKYKYRSTQK